MDGGIMVLFVDQLLILLTRQRLTLIDSAVWRIRQRVIIIIDSRIFHCLRLVVRMTVQRHVSLIQRVNQYVEGIVVKHKLVLRTVSSSQGSPALQSAVVSARSVARTTIQAFLLTDIGFCECTVDVCN